MECTEVQGGEWIERYLGRGLSGRDARRLEEHVLVCEECQAHLEDLSLLRAGLSRDRWAVADEWPEPRSQWRWAWAAGAIVLAAGIGLSVRLLDEHGEPALEGPRAAVVQVPSYEANSLRAAGGDAERRFREAMTFYQEGSFAEAIPGLQAAVDLDPDLGKARFYLGACQLLTGQAADAIDSFARVLSAGDSQFREWAHLLRAEAYLRVGEVDHARSDLRDVILLEGDLQADAQRVLDQLSD